MHILFVFLSGLIVHASEATDITTLTSQALESLVEPAAAAMAHPELGNCPPLVRRVRATDLAQSQVLENAINGYVSGLAADYDFGLLAATPKTEERVRASWRGLSQTPNSELEALGGRVWAAIATTPTLGMDSGTAVYTHANGHSEQRELRVLVDRENNEFLLIAVGICQ